MNYDQPDPSLNLSLSSRNSNNLINLDLVLVDPASSPNSSSSPPFSPAEPPRVFSCNYCRRKFYSSQALGGHQNAHKLERTLAKKSKEFSSVVRDHSVSGLNQHGLGPGRVNRSLIGLENHAGRFVRREINNYGHDQCIRGRESHVHQEDQLSQLDLSLKL